MAKPPFARMSGYSISSPTDVRISRSGKGFSSLVVLLPATSSMSIVAIQPAIPQGSL